MAVLLHVAHSWYSSLAFSKNASFQCPLQILSWFLGDEGEGIYGRMVGIGTKMTLLPNKKIAMHRVRISVQYTVTEDDFYR
jgi:hypothetical protein